MQELGYIHIPKTAVPAKYTFERSLKVLAKELNKHNYLLGNKFSALDIHLLSNLKWADALDWLTGNPDKFLIREYYERVRMRQACETCWKIRQPLDLSRKVHNTFTPQNQ